LTVDARGFLATAIRLVALSAALNVELSNDAAADAMPAPRVLVSTTGNHSERTRTIPITRERGRETRVVMSMKPREVPDFVPGDRVKVTAEVQFSTNCLTPRGPRCVGPAYHYDPVVRTRLVLAHGRKTTGGKRAVRVSRTKRNVCRQRRPFREHHCVITFTKAGFTLREGHPPPCPLDSCRVNLVADAHNPSARSGHRLIVGGLKAKARIPHDRGRMNAIRFHPSDQPEIPALETTHRLTRRFLGKRVVYSQRLDPPFEAGEQLEASGKMEAEISHLPYNVRISAQLILGARRTAFHSTNTVRRVANLDGEISEQNVFNCTRNRPSCTFRKVGALQIEQVTELRPNQPLFVNLVVAVAPKRTTAAPGDKVRIPGRGHVRVVRFPAELKG
jgi:hypothetical protein